MQKIRSLLAIALCSTTAATAQMKYPITWDATARLHAIPADFAEKSAVMVLDQRRLEYDFSEEKNFAVYRSTHRIFHLTDQKGVESFNKLTLSARSTTKLVSIKARAISPSGKVVETGRDKLKEIKGDDGSPEYLLAIEGVEQGGEVELLYTERREISMFGSEIMQYSIPVMQSDFALIVAARIKFDTKGYNGYPKAEDSINSNETLRFYTASQKNIPGLDEEMYGNYNGNLRRLDFKISYIRGEHSDVRQFTWSDLVKNLYEKYYNYKDKELRIADKYLESIGVSQSDDEPTRIQKIEDRLKTDIAMSEDLKEGEDNDDFSTILDKKVTTEQGFTRFFCACLTEAGVKHEFGLASSRYSHETDDSLEVWNQLDVHVIYLPKEQQFLAPNAINLRYPFVPTGITNTKGVFCKATTLGSMTNAIPDLRLITPIPFDKSANNIDATITFSTADMTPQIEINYSFLGYGAMGMRELFLYSPKDKEQELVKQIITLAEKPEDMNSYSIKGKAYKNYYTSRPLELSMSLKAPQLMEKAGPKYLFKVGDVIGRQAEMYANDKRVLPIDIQYAQQEMRNITITIPQGYKVVNPEAVKMNVTQSYNGKMASGFISDYTMDGNVMKIHINEYYQQLHLPASEFEAYRKVINASADFNKVVLVLQKTGS